MDMKRILKNIAIGIIYAIVFIPNFIIGLIEGFRKG